MKYLNAYLLLFLMFNLNSQDLNLFERKNFIIENYMLN